MACKEVGRSCNRHLSPSHELACTVVRRVLRSPDAGLVVPSSRCLATNVVGTARSMKRAARPPSPPRTHACWVHSVPAPRSLCLCVCASGAVDSCSVMRAPRVEKKNKRHHCPGRPSGVHRCWSCGCPLLREAPRRASCADGTAYGGLCLGMDTCALLGAGVDCSATSKMCTTLRYCERVGRTACSKNDQGACVCVNDKCARWRYNLRSAWLASRQSLAARDDIDASCAATSTAATDDGAAPQLINTSSVGAARSLARWRRTRAGGLRCAS